MNLSLAVFLITPTVRMIQVSYKLDRNEQPEGLYSFKTFDRKIKKGDYVIVPTDTRHGLTVVRVEATDIEPDFDSRLDYKWIVGKVDLADFDKIRSQEEDAIVRIQAAEKRKRREELRKALEEDSGADIKALPMYQPSADDPTVAAVVGNEPEKPDDDPATIRDIIDD